MSETPASDRPNGDSDHATVSGDGRYVSFTSTADDIIAEDNDQSANFFVTRLW